MFWMVDGLNLLCYLEWGFQLIALKPCWNPTSFREPIPTWQAVAPPGAASLWCLVGRAQRMMFLPPNWLIVKSFDWHSLQLQCIGWCMFLSTFRILFGNRATFKPEVTCLERQPCALHFSKQWWFFVLTFNFLMQTPNWCGSAPLQRAPNTSTLPLRLGSWSVGIWGQTSGWQHAPSALYLRSSGLHSTTRGRCQGISVTQHPWIVPNDTDGTDSMFGASCWWWKNISISS